jgi:four helix bundle protein
LAEKRGRAHGGSAVAASSTSVAANYRSACRAGSPAAFRHRLGIAEEECDETIFWIKFAAEAELIDAPRTHELLREAGEILAMLVASRRTSSRRTAQSKIENPQSKIP